MSSVRDQFSETLLSDANLADYAAIEPMYVDGVAGVFNLGANFGTMFFRWTPVRSEGGPVMFERSPGLVLVQPRSALLCGKSCRLNAILNAQGVPTVSAPRIVAGTTFN
jgi:hypothetical protein